MDGGSDARRITIHKPADFDGMRAAGRLAAETLDFLAPHVVTGVTTGALDLLCHDFIVAHGAVPAPLNYRGFPKSICTSINHVVCHGIPGDRVLVDGDTLNIDITVVLDGWHGDTSRMFSTGTPSTRASRLIEVTYESLMRGGRSRQARRDAGRCRTRDPELRGSSAVLCGARFLWARDRAAVPRSAERAAFRATRRRAGAEARHVLHRRADGQCRSAGGEGAR